MNKPLQKYSNDPNFVGYPLFYKDQRGDSLCACCAQDVKDEGEEVIQHVNWENTQLWCWTCSEKIESAYAEEGQGE